MKKLALAFALLAAAPAFAEDMTETVVVTASRDTFSERDKQAIPQVVLIRRADHLFNRIMVSDDTRDPVLRTKELRETLKALIAEAKKTPRLSLSIGDKSLKDFTEEMIDDSISGGSYDTIARARIVVKTQISPQDTFDGAAQRIRAFVKRIPSFGRSQTTIDARWDLTIVKPDQYHGAVVAKIGAEAKESAAKFGPDYGAVVDGLQQPLLWYRAGDLNLALFIRYTMVIAQKGTGKIVIQRSGRD